MRVGSFTLGIVLATVALSCSWAQEPAPTVVLNPSSRPSAGSVSTELRAADAAVASQVLGNALGATVRFDGTVSSPITLELQGVTGRAALDALAAAVRGTWRPVYSLIAGAAPGSTPRPVPVGRTVTASLSGVNARTALSLVARGVGGSVEMVSELPQTVSLNADSLPVEQAMDEIARQVGGSWSVTYVVRPGAAPATPAPTAARPPASTPNAPRQPRATPNPRLGRSQPQGGLPQALPPDVLKDRRFFPMPFEPQPGSPQPQAPAPDPNAAKMLGEGLARVMQMPPVQRRAAVKDFASQVEQQFRQMQSLPAARKTEQMAAMRPLYQAAVRTFSGLTPDQQKEFRPIVEVFNRWMR